MVYVHAEAGETDISWDAEPVLGLQLSTKCAVAGQAVADDAGALGGDLVLQVIQGKVVE